MSFDLNAILNQIGRDKGIDKTLLVEAIESAMLSAARKHYGHNLILETQFDEDTGVIELLQFKVVVENVDDPDTQISLDEARADYDPEAMVGDELGKKLETEELGRIAAQTAKQVIVQKFRNAERGVIYEEYKNSKGDLINGIVQRFERGDLIVNLGRTEAILPRREQIPRERYNQGDRVRCLILDIDPTRRGPQIILSRSHPQFLIKLFKEEVPEIEDGTIEIKGAARDAGVRAKIAVDTSDPLLDPVGACVGIKGSRVHNVGQELRGERIDVIPWSDDAPSFVARALSPAEVNRVLLNEAEHSMEVIVPDDQLSFAIGRGGQNVKLASKLTGWKIDVRSVTAAEEEAKASRQQIESIPDVPFAQVEFLLQSGYRSVNEIANASVQEIMEVEGFTEESAQKLLESAQKVADEELLSNNLKKVADLDSLYLAPELSEKLISKGFNSVQDLVVDDLTELLTGHGLIEDEINSVQAALDSMFSAKAENKTNDGAVS